MKSALSPSNRSRFERPEVGCTQPLDENAPTLSTARFERDGVRLPEDADNDHSSVRPSFYDEQVVDAAYIHSRPRCFFVGPYARRVTFASQQYRVLDLVRALNRRRRFAERRNDTIVAVVGGGVAGVTAAAALRGAGCRVHLFERHEKVLSAQSAAIHRLIHPTISRWPTETLKLTTEFPFMDWFAAPCSVVIEFLKEEWRTYIEPSVDDKDFRVFRNVAVTGSIANDGGRVSLETSSEEVAQQLYDYVFFTTGFEKEAGPSGLPCISYWAPGEDVDLWRKSGRKAYVSGAGDGGLIDCLRLVHKDFDTGWLTVRVAEMLGESIEARIDEAEREALMIAKSVACTTIFDKSGTRNIKSNSDYNLATVPLAKLYSSLAEDLPSSVTELLDDSLTRSGVTPGRVTLVAKDYAPYTSYSAPIHKLMIAHARSKNMVVYKTGRLTASNKKGGKSKKVGGKFELTGPLQDAILVAEDEYLIVRHGAQAALDSGLSSGERESLRLRQFMLADYIDNESERSLTAPPSYPDKALNRPGFIASRLSKAQALVKMFIPSAAVTAFEDRFQFEVPDAGPPAVPSTGSPLNPGALPAFIFGIPLVKGVMLESSAFW